MMPPSLPRVRVTSMLTCPNASCMRTIYTPTIRVGQVWMKCNQREKDRRGSCPAHWFNITLPPGSHGRDVAAIVGEDAAWRLLLIVGTPPYFRDGKEQAFAMLLTSDTSRPVHIQIASRARDEHHLRFAPIADVMRALIFTPN